MKIVECKAKKLYIQIIIMNELVVNNADVENVYESLFCILVLKSGVSFRRWVICLVGHHFDDKFFLLT